MLTETKEQNKLGKEVLTEAPPLSTQRFLGCIADWVFALLVFFLVFHLPVLALRRWANNVDTGTSLIGLQCVGLLVSMLGILWCLAFALKGTARFLKASIQASD